MAELSVANSPAPTVITFPNSPFKLHQPFPPAGDQPTAIEGLIEGIDDGLMYQTLLGVTGSGKTYTMANVIARAGRPAIVFAPNKTLAAQLYAEFREFFPQNAVEYFVSYYDYYQPEAYVPQRDLFIEKDSSINEHIEQMRLSCTKSLMERRDVVIVATVSAIYGIGNPSEYHKMVLTLRAGDKVAQRDVIARLIQMQYTRNEMDFARGTFRVRGDTIDIFPAEHAELAIRVEMFDDEIESLQLFDPLTGKVRQKIPRFTVYPGSHYVTGRATVLKAVDSIKAELRDRLEEFRQQGKLLEEQRLEQRTRFDIEMLAEVGFTKGIENYSRHLSGSMPGAPPPTLTEYLSDHGIKVRYLHSDIDTVERVEILRDLRLGTFDVVVGINLLREGLDLPEVSLVAVLDADKEGFLRSERSLIQTIGRAARNLNGVAILYADQMTDSMQKAIGETERRRAKQIAFNEAHGITPKGVNKKIKDMIDGVYSAAAQKAMLNDFGMAEDAAKVEGMSEKQISKEIKRLEKLMVDHAKNLEFEKAAQVRDQLHVLKQQAFGAPGADNVVAMLGK